MPALSKSSPLPRVIDKLSLVKSLASMVLALAEAPAIEVNGVLLTSLKENAPVTLLASNVQAVALLILLRILPTTELAPVVALRLRVIGVSSEPPPRLQTLPPPLPNVVETKLANGVSIAPSDAEPYTYLSPLRLQALSKRWRSKLKIFPSIDLYLLCKEKLHAAQFVAKTFASYLGGDNRKKFNSYLRRRVWL